MRFKISDRMVELFQIEFLPYDVMLSTLDGAEYLFPLVLWSAADISDKLNNLISYNGTCSYGSEAFRPSCFPFLCEIRFNNPIPSLKISSLFEAAPDFNIKSGN